MSGGVQLEQNILKLCRSGLRGARVLTATRQHALLAETERALIGPRGWDVGDRIVRASRRRETFSIPQLYVTAKIQIPFSRRPSPPFSPHISPHCTHPLILPVGSRGNIRYSHNQTT